MQVQINTLFPPVSRKRSRGAKDKADGELAPDVNTAPPPSKRIRVYIAVDKKKTRSEKAERKRMRLERAQIRIKAARGFVHNLNFEGKNIRVSELDGICLVCTKDLFCTFFDCRARTVTRKRQSLLRKSGCVDDSAFRQLGKKQFARGQQGHCMSADAVRSLLSRVHATTGLSWIKETLLPFLSTGYLAAKEETQDPAINYGDPLSTFFPPLEPLVVPPELCSILEPMAESRSTSPFSFEVVDPAATSLSFENPPVVQAQGALPLFKFEMPDADM